jgi:hypothetical protein
MEFIHLVLVAFGALLVIGFAQRFYADMRAWWHDWADPLDYHDGDGGM